MAWQALVSSPEVAKESKHQIVETEHLMKALLEQKNGLARRIFSKAGVDNTRLLEATDKFIQRQPKVLPGAEFRQSCYFLFDLDNFALFCIAYLQVLVQKLLPILK